jgi:hypothetical protein
MMPGLFGYSASTKNIARPNVRPGDVRCDRLFELVARRRSDRTGLPPRRSTPDLMIGDQMRIGIIGAGAVGSACLTAVVMRGFAREVVVLDRDRNKARGLVTDVQYGAMLSPALELRDGDYADLAGASVVMITAGINERQGFVFVLIFRGGSLCILVRNFFIFK